MPRMYGACVVLTGGRLTRIQVAWPSVLIVLREGLHSHHRCAGTWVIAFEGQASPAQTPGL